MNACTPCAPRAGDFARCSKTSACVAPARKLLKRVKRAAAITDSARNAGVLLALLERSIEPGERDEAAALLASLREPQEDALRCARRRLRRASDREALT